MATADFYYKAWQKDPDELSDFTTDWSDQERQDWTTDPIAASEWFIDEGTATISGTPSFTGTVATVKLAGGKNAERNVVRNRVTSTGGNIFDRSFVIGVREF